MQGLFQDYWQVERHAPWNADEYEQSSTFIHPSINYLLSSIIFSSMVNKLHPRFGEPNIFQKCFWRFHPVFFEKFQPTPKSGKELAKIRQLIFPCSFVYNNNNIIHIFSKQLIWLPDTQPHQEYRIFRISNPNP